ncbi:ATP-binding protein [Microcoleus sp. N9_A1]|uniref:ATP-binding protein n=1 Tax=Microcoleus sp. N9_A1 TaxID=3055380 RepID=UPI002FD757DB
MRQQSLSRKIVLAYSLLITLAAGLLTSGLYWQLRTVQRQEMRDRLLELLRLATPQIDSDYLALTVSADNMKEPFYKINQERLQNIQTASPSINHIYTLRQQSNGQVVFVLDLAQKNRPLAVVGEPLEHSTSVLQAGIANLQQPTVERDIQKNSEGLPVLYGYSPIKNQFGRTNGLLVIELNASAIIQSELQVGAIAITIFGVVLLLTLIAIRRLAQSLVVRPILQLNQASKQLANGEWSQTLPTDRSDELGELATSFNHMAGQLKESFETLEQRVQERTTELEAAMQLADSANQAKSDFLASMSHELRTPLNGILGYAQILQGNEPLTERGKKGVDVIYQCGNHLLNLINDILDLAKIEARKLELSSSEVHLPAFLEGIAEIVRVRANQKGIPFTYEPDADLPTGVTIDEKRLRQVLINLLGNAIKFTDKGGVTFRTKSHKIERATYQIRFEIEDTGVGISPDGLTKIFQPFEQVGEVKKQAEGTGLGLAISQQIVTLMGSTLNVKSQLGQGSTFWFEVELPEAKDWATTLRTTHEGKIVGFGGGKRLVLVVDDRWENRSVVVSLLEPLGFEMMEASNGREGLEKAKEHHPDLIITDLMMPEMDGYQMLRQIRSCSQLQDVAAIASSASVFESNQNESIQAGANVFLPKPIEALKLLELVQKYLNLEWLYDNESIASEDATADSLEPSSSTPEIVPPTNEVLSQLHKLALQGRLMAIEQQLKILEVDRQYKPFVQEVRYYAENFQIEKIPPFLERYLPAE